MAAAPIAHDFRVPVTISDAVSAFESDGSVLEVFDTKAEESICESCYMHDRPLLPSFFKCCACDLPKCSHCSYAVYPRFCIRCALKIFSSADPLAAAEAKRIAAAAEAQVKACSTEGGMEVVEEEEKKVDLFPLFPLPRFVPSSEAISIEARNYAIAISGAAAGPQEEVGWRVPATVESTGGFCVRVAAAAPARAVIRCRMDERDGHFKRSPCHACVGSQWQLISAMRKCTLCKSPKCPSCTYAVFPDHCVSCANREFKELVPDVKRECERLRAATFAKLRETWGDDVGCAPLLRVETMLDCTVLCVISDCINVMCTHSAHSSTLSTVSCGNCQLKVGVTMTRDRKETTEARKTRYCRLLHRLDGCFREDERLARKVRNNRQKFSFES